MLAKSGGMAWGVWQIPEAELRVLGDVRDRDILESSVAVPPSGRSRWPRRAPDPWASTSPERQHAGTLMARGGSRLPAHPCQRGSRPVAGRKLRHRFLRSRRDDLRRSVIGRCPRPRRAGASRRPVRVQPRVIDPVDRVGGRRRARGRPACRRLLRGCTSSTTGDPVDFQLLPYGEAGLDCSGANGFCRRGLRIEQRPAPDATSTYRDVSSSATGRAERRPSHLAAAPQLTRTKKTAGTDLRGGRFDRYGRILPKCGLVRRRQGSSEIIGDMRVEPSNDPRRAATDRRQQPRCAGRRSRGVRARRRCSAHADSSQRCSASWERSRGRSRAKMERR